MTSNVTPLARGARAIRGLAMIPLTELHPSPNNPRERLTDIDELAQSIYEQGIIQPLVVQKISGRDGFQIVAGHRRYAAAKKIRLPEVLCVIRKDMLPDEELLAMLVENGQRAGLDPIEEARALKRLVSSGLSQTEVARKVGRSVATVSNRILLLSLPVEEQEQLRAGAVTTAAAQRLARVETGRINKPKKKSSQHLAIEHPLAKRVRARCRRLGHRSKGAASVGGVACGVCWETVIRADERDQLHDQSNARGRCVLCDTTHVPDGSAT